jgi:hypothetical protein
VRSSGGRIISLLRALCARSFFVFGGRGSFDRAQDKFRGAGKLGVREGEEES